MAETRIRGALDYLRMYGWIQGSMGEDGEARCSVGAIASAWEIPACEVDYQRGPARDVATLSRVVNEHWPQVITFPPPDNRFDSAETIDFNDYEATGFVDIERAFEKAAAKAEEFVE